MDQRRLELQTLLEGILGKPNDVHFQPGKNTTLNYPVILYTWDGDSQQHANNLPYRQTKRYEVTVIDRDPDSEYPDAIRNLPRCAFSRKFVVDGLNHTVFNLYF